MALPDWLSRLVHSRCIPFHRPSKSDSSPVKHVDPPNSRVAREVSSKPPSTPLSTSHSNTTVEEHKKNTERSPLPKFVVHHSEERVPVTQDDVEHIPPPSAGSLTPRTGRRGSGSSSLLQRSDSRDSATGQHELRDLLESEELESSTSRLDRFIPAPRLEALITVSAVTADIQARDPYISPQVAHEYAKRVCESSKPAKRLYATLASVNRGADICGLLDEGVGDDDLPLQIRAGEGEVLRKDGQPVKTLMAWKKRPLTQFDRCQFCMISPVFSLLEHYDFEEDVILPFLPLKPGDNLQPKRGGYSRVFPARMHPHHHGFWPTSDTEDHHNGPLIAVKQLDSQEEAEFRKEETILKELGTKNHAHLIKLLGTYKKGGHYHLMFPYADANLRTYWDARPSPGFDAPTILWSLRQMKGIAHALQVIHNFAITIPIAKPDEGERRTDGEPKLSIRKGEELYGRHGDIKPENILWFKVDPSLSKDPYGILQIADFGLGRFHGRDSRSQIPAETAVASPTYEPPECKLRLPVSRAYDIWSLGCLFLEFITWLLKGSEKIGDFSDFRGRVASSTGFDEDYFYTILKDNRGIQEATVNSKVCEWVEQLHSDKKCSQLIHDLLECTMTDLLLVDAKTRAPARLLYQKLSGYLERAERDTGYILLPVTHQPSHKRASSSSEGCERLNPKGKSTKLVDHTSDPAVLKYISKRSPANYPKDLVLRHVNTPAKTWPSGQPG